MATVQDSLLVAFSYRQSGRFIEAAHICRQIVAIEPSNAQAWHYWGTITSDIGDLEKAEQYFRRALELRPDFVEGHYNLGICLDRLMRSAEAIVCFRNAVSLKPVNAEPYYSLGHSLDGQGNWSEAIACYRRAIELKPDYADAHWNLSLLLLLMGDFDQGWQEYEWRLKIDQTKSRDFRQPKWKGEPLTGKTILLHAEQGLGDKIQFVRYAALVKEQNSAATCRGVPANVV